MMNYSEFKQEAFKIAMELGCDAAELYFVEGSSFSVNVIEKELDEYNVKRSFGLNLRVQFENKNGYAYTESMDAPEDLVKRAIDNAKAIEMKDEHPMQGECSYKSVENPENPLTSLTEKEKIDLAFEIERKMFDKDDRVVRVEDASVATSKRRICISNTKGLDAVKESVVSYTIAAPIMKQGEDYKSAYAFRAGSNAMNIDDLACEAVSETAMQFDASPVPAKRYRVLFRNTAAADLLAAFVPMFSAAEAQRGLSLLEGKEGEKIASELINIVDNPFYPGYECPFDDEGVPSVTKSVVEKGVLKTLLHNLKTAKKAGVDSTSNAGRASAASPIDVAPSVFCVEPGETSYDELLKRLDNGLIITTLSGLHSGVNEVSGEFSLLAGGLLVENGEVVRSVDQITVGGSFFEFLNGVEVIGSDLWMSPPIGPVIGAPSILVSEIQVAGKQ